MASIKEEAINVLIKSNVPLHYEEIRKKLVEQGIMKPASKKEGIHVIMNGDVKKNRNNSPFIKCEKKGYFKLNPLFNVDDYKDLGGLSPQKEAQKFEERVKNLLKKMEFDRVDGARNDFRVGGHQIDVAALHEKSILVFECKMLKNVRKEICELRGKTGAIIKGFKNMPGWDKATHFRFILIVNKNIPFREEDVSLAKQTPNKIHLLNEDALEYYNELYGILKPFSKYNFLGELQIKPFHSKSNQCFPYFLQFNLRFLLFL